MGRAEFQVREARLSDRQRLANLIHFEEHVHRHLDWKSALDWIGTPPFMLAEKDGQLLGALACPPDPQVVAWLRLFAVMAGNSLDVMWQALWEEAENQLAQLGVRRAYALTLQNWLTSLLNRAGCAHVQDVVVMVWDYRPVKPGKTNQKVQLRSMKIDDLPHVWQVDSLAFDDEWRNSLEALEQALEQSAVATVAELEDRVVGYQISTQGPMGGHLARLAVHPNVQGQGVGSALVYGLLETFVRRGVHRVTVNTQADNLASLAIYRKCGYVRTGEVYPVFRLTTL